MCCLRGLKFNADNAWNGPSLAVFESLSSSLVGQFSQAQLIVR